MEKKKFKKNGLVLAHLQKSIVLIFSGDFLAQFKSYSLKTGLEWLNAYTLQD